MLRYLSVNGVFSVVRSLFREERLIRRALSGDGRVNFLADEGTSQLKTKSAKRVLWMVNHKTLLESEAQTIASLGFEIFIPKVIPDSSRFRSGGFTFDFDHTLSLPKAVLQKLNKVDFFESELSPNIVRLINRYFDAVFVLPFANCFSEMIRKFEGEIFFRAYGLEGNRRYSDALTYLYGATIIQEFLTKKEKVWFAQGYAELAENEPPVIADRALTLPLGLPNRYWDLEGTHQGNSKKVMFVCPQIATNPFYKEVYEDFKSFIGDIPHVILGVQDIAVDDPNVLGYVTDSDLVSVYQDSAALYYPSRNPRHVHYTPIEASVIGLPIVFYEGSLLSRIAPEVDSGKCRTEIEARDLLSEILENDVSFGAAIAIKQKPFGDRFTEEYCLTIWRDELSRTLLGSGKVGQENFWIEAKRFLLMPFLRGRVSRYKTPPDQPKWEPDFQNMSEVDNPTLCAGIDFTSDDVPSFVRDFSGLAYAEPYGRWSDGKRITLELEHALPEFFELQLEGFAHSSNAGETLILRVGRKSHCFSLGDGQLGPEKKTILVQASQKFSDIEILIPKPCTLPNDNRRVGICLRNIKIVPVEAETIIRVRRRLPKVWTLLRIFRNGGLLAALGTRLEFALDIEKFESRALEGSTLFREIDFSREELPAYLVESSGLSWAESGGRWSDTSFVVLKFSHTFPKTFALELNGFPYSNNTGKDIEVQIGDRTKVFSFVTDEHQTEKVVVLFNDVSPTNVVRFRVPSTATIPSDSRSLGIFFSSLKIKDLDDKDD